MAGILAGRGESLMGLATGSCVVKARKEEEAMLSHRRRVDEE